MKKIILLIFLFICPKVYAKECLYNKALIFENGSHGLYTKVKINYEDEKIETSIIDSIDEKYKIVKEGKSIVPALYNKETNKFDKDNSDTEIYNMITYDSFKKVYKDRCPVLKVFERKLTVTGENSTSGINGELYTSSSSNDINYYECVKSISTNLIPNINGTTIKFRLYNDGSKYICILPVWSEAKESCMKINTSITNVSVKPPNKETITFQIIEKEYNNIFKDIKNNKFTCPNNIYASRKQVNANLIYLSTNKEDASNNSEINNDKVVSTNDGKAEDNESKDNITVYRIRKPSISINLDLSKSGCDVLGKDLTEFLQTILDVIRILGVLLAILLSMYDYISSVASNDQDSLKKANKNLGTRVLLTGILLLVPVIVEFALTLIDIVVISSNPNCGIS